MLLLKNIFLLFLLAPIFIIELVVFKISKRNCSNLSHQFLIRLFTITGGFTNDLINNFLKENKTIDLANTKFNSGNININKNIKELNINGYYINEKYLDDVKIENILNKLKHLNGRYSGDNVNDNKIYKLNLKQSENSARFTYESDDLLEIPEIQNLLLSSDILKTAQMYLNSLPIIDIVTAWWTFPTDKSDEQSAQFWHYDMDRPKWLKLFLYLNDVNLDNGPHCFVAKSHLNNGINYNIRKYGYSRIQNNLIEKYYSNNDIKYITAKKGSLLFEDTRGLHKGLKVKKSSRLLLQFQYSTSLFGATSKKLLFPQTQTELFKKMRAENPLIFQAFK